MKKIFIIGAHRSGTSKLASYFSDVLKFSGYAEGHIYRLVSHLLVGKVDIISTIPPNAYEVNQIGIDFVIQSLVKTMDQIISAHHEYKDYYDKTPGFRMIDASPVISRAIPEARFIHMHRHGIENVNSNLRLWPDRYFKDACHMWASPIKSFLAAKQELGEKVIDFDMNDFIVDPYGMHNKLANHIDLKVKVPKLVVEDYFASGSSTSTRSFKPVVVEPKLDEQDWSEADKDTFRSVCGPAMEAMGYSY